MVGASARQVARSANTLVGLASSTRTLPVSFVIIDFVVFSGVAIVGRGCFFELRGRIEADHGGPALFVVVDSVTLFCVCRGFKNTRRCKSMLCKQWSFMILSVSTCKYARDTFTHGNRQKTVRIMLEALRPHPPSLGLLRLEHCRCPSLLLILSSSLELLSWDEVASSSCAGGLRLITVGLHCSLSWTV